MSSSPTSSSSSDADGGLAALGPMADVLCGVEFVIGTSQMTVAECLRLGPASVVRLSQTAGGDFDVRVNGVSVASGEVAVIDDMAAVRISRLTVPSGVGWD